MRALRSVLTVCAALGLCLGVSPWRGVAAAEIDTPTLLTSGTPTNNTTSYTTASISPTANSLLIVTVEGVDAALASVPDLTVSGLSLTWTQWSAQPIEGVVRGTIWTAPTGGSPGSGTLSVTSTLTLTGLVYRVEQITGVHLVVPVVQSNGEPSATSTTLSAFGSARNGTYAGCFFSGVADDLTPGSGFTGLGNTRHVDDDVGFTIGVFTEYRIDNDTTPDYNAPTDVSPDGIIALEIQSRSGVPGLINSPLSY